MNTEHIILGIAVADAMGVPAEFKSRKTLKQKPVTGYTGYGTHPVPAGTWSDDTSMVLASLDSLSYGTSYEDMMERFCDWKNSAEYTATGEVFDMGISTHEALCRYEAGTAALECGCAGEYDNGNGSLMRIAPAVLYCRRYMAEKSTEEHIELIHNVSALTHSHKRSQVGCGIYYFLMMSILDSKCKGGIAEGLANARSFYGNLPGFKEELTHYARIFDEHFAGLDEDEIRSTGYVTHTLEAALWCLLNSESYEECVLKAVNLGEDTDTVAAVAGGLAAALYDDIPDEWTEGLISREMISEICRKFDSAKNV